MALTELTVRNTKPSDKPVKLTDGNGMHLLITTSGSVSIPLKRTIHF